MNDSSPNQNLFTEEEDIKYNSQHLFTEEETKYSGQNLFLEEEDNNNHSLFTEEEDIKYNNTNIQHLFTEEEDIKCNNTKSQNVFNNIADSKSNNMINPNIFTEEEDLKINNYTSQHLFFEEEEEEVDSTISLTSLNKQQFFEDNSQNRIPVRDHHKLEEEEEESDSHVSITAENKCHQLIEEEEEEDSFVFESTESYTKPSYIEDDHVELITDNDDDTIKLLKKLDNMNLDLSIIENPPDESQEEEENEEINQTQFKEEEDIKDDDTFSISNYDMSISNDTRELFNVIDNLKIENNPEKERPLQTFDPPLTKEELSTNDNIAEEQFNFQDSLVYRDIEADMKPFKQRGNKRAIYDELQSFDCVALVIDPSKPENEIDDYVTPDFNQADEAAIITARTKDAPLPDYEILTPYNGEIESLILQAYLDFNDL